MFRASVIGALFAVAAVTAAPAATPGNVGSLGLSGTYTCTGGGAPAPYKTTWSPILGGSWLRDEDADSENLVTLDKAKHVWRVTSIDNDNGTIVWEAPATSAKHAAFHEVFPGHARSTTYDSVSPAKYTLTFVFPAHGKVMHSVATCTKG